MLDSRRTIFICYVGWLFDFYDLVLISYLLPQIVTALSVTPEQEALLLGAGLGASGLGGILFGWLGDHYGRKQMMTWTIFLYSVGTALSAFSPTAHVFIALRVLAGIGIGGEWAVGHALVAEAAPSEKRGRAAALLQSGEPAGVALAAFVGLLIAPHVGWRVIFFVSGITALWSVVVRKYLPESRVWEQSQKSNRARESYLLTRHGFTTAVLAFGLAVFKLGTYWTCYVWLPKIFHTRFHLSLGQSFLWILTAQVGQLCGMLAFGRLADTLGRRWSFTLYSTLTALSLSALAFQWETLLAYRPLFWIVMLMMGIGSGCTAGFGALLAELFPTSVRNFAMGTVYNLARGSQLFAPFVVMSAMKRWDLQGALGVPLVLATLTAIWVWTLPETKGRDLATLDKA